jgi:glycosyltransferase involved in cell wall biosynthesis
VNKKSKALTLSIVIPAYNEESYLRACLDSVAAQDQPPEQVIVVDNNSTDDTAKLAEGYPFVTLLTEKKQGVVHARNTGFEAATGDIIGRIDADTVLEPDWSKRVREDFKNDDIAAVTGSGYWYDMPLAPYNYLVEHMFKGPLYRFDKDFPFLFGTNMAIRRSAWEEVQVETCTDKDIHEDMDLGIHLFKHGLKTYYDARLRVGMSARRLDDRPKDFYRYMSMMPKTFQKHGMKTGGVQVSIIGYTLGYLVTWPLRRSYDDTTKRRHIKKLILGNKPRKNPAA